MASTPNTTPARAYCVTVNRELDKFHSALSSPSASLSASVRYAVWQFEKAPDTGRVHIQAYLEFKSPVRIAGVKSLFEMPSLHCEKRRGTPGQAREYCMKEESRQEGEDKGPFEFGQFGGAQGKRNDLALAAETMRSSGLTGVAENHPTQFIRYHAGFKALEYILSTKGASCALRNVDVISISGAPGTGKTRFAWDLSNFMNVPAYRLMPPTGRGSQLWFDGYEGQKMLIIDEMSGNWMPWSFFLNLLDVYPLQLPAKGTHHWARFTTIVICTNEEPATWFPYSSGGMDRGAVMRRLTSSFKAEKVESEGVCSYVLWDEEGKWVDKELLMTTMREANITEQRVARDEEERT